MKGKKTNSKHTHTQQDQSTKNGLNRSDVVVAVRRRRRRMGGSCIVNSFRLPTFKSPNGFLFILHSEQQLKEAEQKIAYKHKHTRAVRVLMHTHIQSMNTGLVLVIYSALF